MNQSSRPHHEKSNSEVSSPRGRELHSFCAGPADKNKRLDVYLAESPLALSRSQVARLIEEWKVHVNGNIVKASYKIKPNDSILLEKPPPAPLALQPEKVPFSVIYEDEDILVLSKPPGIVVHPGAGHSSGTLVHGLLEHCNDLSGIGGILRPGIVHRLDRDTSGLMVIAKNDGAHQKLSAQFKAGQVRKKYIALVYGNVVEKTGIIEKPIGRHPVHRKKMSVQSTRSREARTLWKVVKSFEGLTLLELTLQTGRTHQIRVHLASINHPVVGDAVYGGKVQWMGIVDPKAQDELKKVKRQLLHSRELGFVHPRTGNLVEFMSPVPQDMRDVIDGLL